MRWLWRQWSPGFELPPEEWARLRETFDAPGVAQAMLAYYRQNATPPVLPGWRKTPATERTVVPVRTLAITGADDGCMDTRLYDHLFRDEDFPKGIRVERFHGAGHFVHLERPDEFNELLLEWLGQGGSGR